ncbi:glycosyltransferase [Staphylococcus equorum]|uniref:glycosyltransferase n=1 Tax=Staphylococcus equorum TaxID=246432 RepID=UPI002DBEDC24|nr:glycosyltransferase [Staphylococcus equorum]MEB8108838.1 glycosyltransferase [Staphylococcus equorum]
MKILHIIQSLESGGAEQALCKLVNNDLLNEHLIILLFKSEIHYNLNENIKVINLNLDNTLIDKIRILKSLSKKIKYIQPDIVHTWMNSNFYAPILKKKFKKTKFLISIRHGINRKYLLLNRPVLKKFFKNLDGTIFVSNSSKNEFADTEIIFPNKTVIQNGFDEQKYDYAFNPKNQIFNFAYVGRKNVIKNQNMLIKAFDKFSEGKENVNLLIAGKNMEEYYFEQWINSKNKSKFHWMGEIKNPLEIYRKADVLILTSNSEGFPNVIGEAMSIGVPVITTNAGESFDVVGSTGFKIDNNIESLINVLEEIYHDPTILLDRSLNAYKKINKEYSIDKIILEYDDYYNTIIKG